MYQNDSFFDLSTFGQMGLGAISALMGVAVIWLGYRLMRRRRKRRTRMVIALALLWLFVWLSPQVYYTYYIFIIPDLPWQSVIRTPPGPVDMFEILSFSGRQDLSAHSKGLLGWALILIGFFRLK